MIDWALEWELVSPGVIGAKLGDNFPQSYSVRFFQEFLLVAIFSDGVEVARGVASTRTNAASWAQSEASRILPRSN